MGFRFGTFARAQKEEQVNLDKVSSTLGEMTVGVGCCCSCHEEAKGGRLILMGRGVLVSKVPEHAGEVLIKISSMRLGRLAQV